MSEDTSCADTRAQRHRVVVVGLVGVEISDATLPCRSPTTKRSLSIHSRTTTMISSSIPFSKKRSRRSWRVSPSPHKRCTLSSHLRWSCSRYVSSPLRFRDAQVYTTEQPSAGHGARACRGPPAVASTGHCEVPTTRAYIVARN